MRKLKVASGHWHFPEQSEITGRFVAPVSRAMLDYWIGGAILAILVVVGLALPMI
jgi:hypothetical protein